MVNQTIVSRLYQGRQEAPMDDQLYDFTRQKKLAELLELNCALLERKLLLCNVKTQQGKCDESTFLGVIISGARDVATVPSSTPMLYVKVQCGEAVFHTHPFEKDSTDWASAPMEIKWSEVPSDRLMSLSLMDQTGQEVAHKEVEIDLPVGNGFDRWIAMDGPACLRLQVEHKGVPSMATTAELEADIMELVSKRRHLRANIASALPPMSYATYTTMVSEVERRLCDEIDHLRAALENHGVFVRTVDPVRVVETVREAPGVIRVEDAPGGAVRIVEEAGVQLSDVHVVADDGTQSSPLVQSLLATLTGRNRVIRQLQDTLAGIETGRIPNSSETILLLASQLEERETVLSQLKADLPPLSLSALVIDQSNVINTLLSQLHKALGSLSTSNKCVERLTGQAVLFGGDIIMKELEAPPEPILTPEQVAALLTRFDDSTRRMKELETLIAEQDHTIRQQESLIQERERQLHALGVQVLGPHVTDVPPSTMGIATVDLCNQFNDSLKLLSDVCYFLAGEVDTADEYKSLLPTPMPLPPAGAADPVLAGTLAGLQKKIADAHLILYDEAKSALPRMERLRYLNAQEDGAIAHTLRTLKLKLVAREQDFDDLLADHEALKVALATARQQLAGPLVVRSDGNLDQLLLDTCGYLADLIPEAERITYLTLPLRRRLPALLQAINHQLLYGGTPGLRVTPMELRGVLSRSPYVRARLGNAVLQTECAPNGRWNTPLTFAADPTARDIEVTLHDRDSHHPIGRAILDLEQFPYGVDTWVPLDNGGDLRLRIDRCRLGPKDHMHRDLAHHSASHPPAALEGIAQKMENTIDVLSRGKAHLLRPAHVTPAYLHKLADILWELAHGGANPLLPPGALGAHGAQGQGGRRGTRAGEAEAVAAAAAADRAAAAAIVAAVAQDAQATRDAQLAAAQADLANEALLASQAAQQAGLMGQTGIMGNAADQAALDPAFYAALNAGLDPAMIGHLPNASTLQFLMRSRAGLIRRIWACLQICKLCNNLTAKHHGIFSRNRGHKMDLGQFKAALEDLATLLADIGSLEDGLAWIVSNYFTDSEKLDLGTSPHLYTATEGIRALPGLIESTDMIEARRLSPSKHRAPRTPSPRNRRDFLRRLENAHMTVLDAQDGVLDGKYFGHDLRAISQLDGDVHGLFRRKVY